MNTTDNKKLDQMMQPLLSDSELKLVQDGIHHMFHVIRDIVAPRQIGAKLSQTELIEKINKLEQEKWERIRTGIMESKCHTYRSTNFTDAESKTPVKIMYDLMSIVANLKDLIETRIKEHFETEKKYRAETNKLKETFSDVQSELGTVRYNHTKDKSTLNVVLGQVKHLEQMNQEKSEKIAELQRENNVKLWAIEKDRILEKANQREKDLEEQMERLISDKESMSKKVEMLENNYRVEKLKNEIGSAKKPPISSEAGADLVRAKQHIYVLEKDLRAIENELFSQQKYMIGLLKGIKEDYWDSWDEVLSEEKIPEANLRKGRQLGSRIVKIFSAAAEGTLGAIRADLPENYLATDKEVNRVPVRKISSAYGVKLTPIPQNEVVSSNGLITQTGKAPINGAQPKNGSRRSSSILPEGALTGYTRTGRRRSSVLPDEHPVLVNPQTGFVNMIRVMRWFPFMTQEYVQEQWGHFKEYDTNGDGDLDLPEMMDAMRNTVGDSFSAAQVKDAMMEVDLDGSCTIDFFEYLSIASMLQDKKGRSEVFRSNVARESGKHVSKTCVVQ